MAAVLRLPRGEGVDDTLPGRDRALALTLLLSLVGLFTAAFFLSRSYMIVLYFFAALVTGFYLGARQRHATLPAFSFAHSFLRWVPATMGSIAGLFVLVAVLLHTA
jgi:putative inorganic carbon (hco3(-)) transporter